MKDARFAFAAISMAMAWSGSAYAQEYDRSQFRFTGPLGAPGAVAQQPGGFWLQPYLIFNDSHRNYDNNGDLHRKDESVHQWTALMAMSYGLTERITAHATLGASRSPNGHGDDAWRMNDTAAKLSYMVLAPNADGTSPAISVYWQHKFATGSYHRLGDPYEGTGSGAGTDTFTVVGQRYQWLDNGRPLRWRLYLSHTLSPGNIDIEGLSVYGTNPEFQGRVDASRAFGAGMSAEYNIDNTWGLAVDLAWSRTSRSHVSGVDLNEDGTITPVNFTSPTSYATTLAPAVVYNFSDAVGLLVGVETTLTGRNTGQYLSPQVSLGMQF